MNYNKRDEEAGKTDISNNKKYIHLFYLIGGDAGLFYHVDKTVVLQEARVFNSSPINARKCRLLLTKIIYLLYIGEPFTVKEATDLFFNVIKLFQSKDVK